MKNKFSLVVILLLSCVCFSQQKITWQNLSKVTYTDKYFPNYDEYYIHALCLENNGLHTFRTIRMIPVYQYTGTM